MFEHSVKVPRPYKLAANIFKKVASEGGSVKTLLYDNKLRHFRTDALYALITETIKHSAHIDKLFENSKILVNEPRLDPWLAKVLTAELLFGKKSLPGKSKPELTVSSYKEQFDKYIADHQDDLKIEAVRRPRYVRINTNLLTTSDAIRSFQDEGYRFVRCTSGSYNDYLQQIQNLEEYDFTQDYHVKTVFVFPTGTRLHEHELYLENKIILQDKATTMAVHLLAPPQGSVVLDMCAAPGMKTTQIAAYMRNQGKIYAVERNEIRYKTLCDFVEKTDCKCVETFHKDTLELKRGDFDDVEYILLDPSCSGSGMDFSVHNYIEPARLAKLTSLQEKFLKHAMNSFPKAKRIVYSTCSVYPEENERVVTNTVRVSRAKWRVQDVKELLKEQWNNFGSNMYGSIGQRCMYAKSDSDLTTGFFLAVLDRDPKDFEKQNHAEKIPSNDVETDEPQEKSDKSYKKKKAKLNGDVTEKGKIYQPENNILAVDNEDKNIKKSKKRKSKSEVDENDGVIRFRGQSNVSTESIEDTEVHPQPRKKIKKYKSYHENEENPIVIEENNGGDSIVIGNYVVQSEFRKRKKCKKEALNDEIGEEESSTQIGTTEGDEVVKNKKRKDSEPIITEDNNDKIGGEESCTQIERTEGDELVKKKKKKKRTDSEPIIREDNNDKIGREESCTQIERTEGDEPVKKKKKKKRKDSEPMITEDNTVSYETKEMPKKKKKRNEYNNEAVE